MDNLNLKVSASPHVRSKDTTSDIMFDVIVALLPATIFGIYLHGVYTAILVAVTVLSCVLFEALYQKGMKKKVTIADYSAVVTGLLLALNLPPKFPIWMAILGSAFAIIVVKQLFGGLGQNFMNPALGARCFLLLSFSRYMTDFVYDGVSTATPLALLKAGEEVNLRNMFFGYTAGTIGETSVIALLIGAIYLLVKKVISPKIPLIYIGSFAVCIAIYSLATGGDTLSFVAAHVCGGGLMLGAWFMATDYVTSPITPVGQILYAVLLGVLTFVLRIFGASAEGVSYAIIISNLLVPLIERVTVPKAFGEGADGPKLSKAEKKAAKKTEEASDADVETDTSEKAALKFDTKGIVKAIFAIFMITVIMGAALGVVYSVTKEPIAEANEKAKQESFKSVFPELTRVEALENGTGEGMLDYEALTETLHKSGFENDSVSEISFVFDDSGVLGMLFIVTDSAGYGGDIEMVVGVDFEGKIKGISFLSIGETAGLGMEATKDSFIKQYVGKNVRQFTYTKTGATVDSEVDALSGATITTSAVTDGVNAALFLANKILGGN